MNTKRLSAKAPYFVASIGWPIFCFYLGGAFSYIIFLLIQSSGVQLDTDSVYFRVTITFISVTVALSSLILIPRLPYVHVLYPRTLAFKPFYFKHSLLIAGSLLLVFALNQFSDIFAELLNLTFDDSRNAASFAASNMTELFGNLLIAGLLTAILEEVLYRGYMYGNLKAISNTAVACIVTSLAFAIMHFDIAFLPFLMVFSLILCLLRERTKSIIPGIVVHALFNGLIVLFAYSGLS